MNIDIYYWILIPIHIILGSICAVHALLYKRDSVAAFGWIAVSLGYPFIGPLLYYLFGINRTSRQARHQQSLLVHDYPEVEKTVNKKQIHNSSHLIEKSFRGLAHLGHELSERSIEAENNITILQNGEQAYPAMLAAIREAKHYILFATYIFETNTIGMEFINALVEAHQRQVQIKVIIDGLGEFYSWPRAQKILKKHGINVVNFDPPTLFPFNISMNLRNHRKMLIVDGECVFAGGMNIGDRHLAENLKNRARVVDTHFKIQGPIVTQCEEIFAEDWYFITKETLILPIINFAPIKGNCLGRAIEDGPNEYLGKLSTMLVNAVSIAQNTIWIMTPYFLPSNELTNALQAAALRGVEVNILLPKKNNLHFVKWAMVHIFPRLLSYGVNIFYQPSPFVHSKLFIVDGYYSLIGSANLDPRSLRLNFELAIEIYNTEFAEQLIKHCEVCLQQSSRITTEKLEDLSLAQKIRNGIFWLFSPYL